MSRRRNPLLAEPPRDYHRLLQEDRITRHGWFDPHIGVHVTEDPRIAAGYADSALDQEAKNLISVLPIVVTIDVKGMPVEPDADALLWWYEKGGKKAAVEVLEHGADGRDHNSYQEASVTGFLIEYLPKQIDWSDVEEDQELLTDALAGDHEALRQLLLTIFPQRRIMQDIDLTNVFEIRTFSSWAYMIATDPGDVEPITTRLGLVTVFREELDTWEPDWRTLWKSPRRRSRHPDRAYHGTTSVALAKAFPELAKYPSMAEVFAEPTPVFRRRIKKRR